MPAPEADEAACVLLLASIMHGAHLGGPLDGYSVMGMYVEGNILL